jgi:hypothetical protein
MPHGGQLRISLPAAVHFPTLWRRVDVAGNRRRHPADAVAAKDQQEGLRPLVAPNCQYEENNRPNDGETSAIGPKISESKHLLSLFLLMDTMYNFWSVGTLMGKVASRTEVSLFQPGGDSPFRPGYCDML